MPNNNGNVFSISINNETGEARSSSEGGNSNLRNNWLSEGADAAAIAQREASARSFGRMSASYIPEGYKQFQGGFDGSDRHKEVTSADVSNMYFNGSIVSTARTSYGDPKGGHNLQRSDIVELPGGIGETSVGAAISMGYLVENEAGQIVDAANAFDKPKAKQEPDPAKDDFGTPEEDRAMTLPDAEAEAFGERIASALPQEHLVRGLEEAVETGGLSEEMILRIAEGLEMSEEQAASEVDRFTAAMQRSYDQAITSAGIASPEMKDDFLRWLDKTDPAKAKIARKAMISKANPAHYAKMASQYVQEMDRRDPDAVMEMATASGIEARKLPNGNRVILNIPGYGEMSWSMAVKDGFVSPPRRA